MAEQTGVTHTGGGNDSPGSALKGKKNRKWIYLGGAGVVILLISHKGSSSAGSSSTGSTDPNQAALDSAAQAETDAALASAQQPGGIAPTTVDTGGGTYNAPGSSIAVQTPANDGSGDASGGGGVDNTVGASSDASSALEGADVSLDAAEVAQNAEDAPAANEAPKHGKPKPAKKSGKVTHPSHGAKVQNHTGATAHGRTFPGAKGVTIGAPRVVNGNVHEDVTVNYGGHTATHTSVNNGKTWIDNTKGKNPPSRGVQNVHPAAAPRPVPVAVRPAPVAAPRPAPRPAPPRPAPRPAPARRR